MIRTTRTGVLWLLCALTVLAISATLAVAAYGQQVTLPLSQFEELRSRANPRPDDPAPPPARFALESADFEIEVGATSARILQKLALTINTDTWERVPLGEAGSFTAAGFGDLQGRVEVNDSQGWALQVRGRGRHEVTLESVVPVRRDETATRPSWGFSLHFPPAAVIRGQLRTRPGVQEVEEVGITGTGLVRGARPGPWTFVSSFARSSGVTFTLYGRRTLPERAQLPLRFEAMSATAAVLSRTQLRVRGWIEARVAQGTLTELRVPLPRDLELVSVSGPIAGWDVDAGTLVVTPLEPVEGALAIELELSGDPRTSFASPVLTPAGSRRTLPLAKAALQGDGILTLTNPGLARGPEASETARLPASVRDAGGRLVTFPDPAQPPLWEAEWAEETEVLAAQVDRLLVDVAVGEAGRAVYRVWAVVRNQGAQQLVLSLPPGFELAGARRDGEEIAAGTMPGAMSGATGGGLAVPLLTREASQAVHLDGVLPLSLPKGDGELSIPLPALSAPAAQVEVRVILPEGRSYRLTDSTRARAIHAPPQGVPRTAASNALAAQVQINSSSGRSAASSADTPRVFDQPPGFVVITAAWSALSINPGPLTLRVDDEKETSPWM